MKLKLKMFMKISAVTENSLMLVIIRMSQNEGGREGGRAGGRWKEEGRREGDASGKLYFDQIERNRIKRFML